MNEKKQSVFDLIQEFEELLYRIEQGDGEITDDTLESLNINEENVKHKTINIINFHKNIGSNVDMLKFEIAKLEKRINSFTKLQERLEQSLILITNTFGTLNTKSKAKYLPHVYDLITHKISTSISEKVYVPSIYENSEYIKNKVEVSNLSDDNKSKLINIINSFEIFKGLAKVTTSVDNARIKLDLQEDIYKFNDKEIEGDYPKLIPNTKIKIS